jgi:hypothetical protein
MSKISARSVRAVFDAGGEHRIGALTELKIGDSIVMVSSEDEREAIPAFGRNSWYRRRRTMRRDCGKPPGP